MRTIHVLSAIAIVAATLGATDWTVGPSGSGAQFSTIQAAVTAAQPGDRVFVMAGSYNGHVLIDKAIEVIGAGSAVTTTSALPLQLPGIYPLSLSITGIAAGSHVRVSGIRFTFIGTMFPGNAALAAVTNCAGRVELCDVRLPGSILPKLPAGAEGGILWISNCAQVVATGLQALGAYLTPAPSIFFPHPMSSFALKGHDGLHVENSSVWLADSLIFGNSTNTGNGGHGIRAIDSFVHLGRSQVRGAQSGGGHLSGLQGFGGAGIHAVASHFIVHGGNPNIVSGANGFEHSIPTWSAYGVPSSAVVLDATSTLIYAADAVLAAGTGTASLPAAPLLVAAPGSTVTPHPHRLPTVSITPVNAGIGTSVTMRLTGEPNLELIRAISIQTAPPIFIGGVLGAVVVDLQAVLFYPVDLIGPSGESTTSVTLPFDPGLAGLEFIEQGAQVLPTGIALSPPIVLTITA
jgi:hypothetical protein